MTQSNNAPRIITSQTQLNNRFFQVEDETIEIPTDSDQAAPQQYVYHRVTAHQEAVIVIPTVDTSFIVESIYRHPYRPMVLGIPCWWYRCW